MYIQLQIAIFNTWSQVSSTFVCVFTCNVKLFKGHVLRMDDTKFKKKTFIFNYELGSLYTICTINRFKECVENNGVILIIQITILKKLFMWWIKRSPTTSNLLKRVCLMLRRKMSSVCMHFSSKDSVNQAMCNANAQKQFLYVQIVDIQNVSSVVS